MTDAVIIFEEDTPYNLITAIMPDVLVKGGDYTIETIVGAKEVISNGGKVIIAPIVEGFSTTGIIEKMSRS
jgi:D-beta-D-heptose 7-phosphate kinase/D-beta-D-heptose 1-phosphate adenosyltransferase